MVEVTLEKEAILEYKVTSSVLLLTAHFNVKNKYGTVGSF